MPFYSAQYQRYLTQKDSATDFEFHMTDREEDINELQIDIDELKKKLKEEINKKNEDIKKLKEELKGIPYIFKVIRYSLSKFAFVKNNVDQQAVWKVHQEVLINHYVKPLYESLEAEDFHPFLKKVGLTKNVKKEGVYAKRIFHLIRRMTIRDREDHAQGICGGISHYKFPISDDAYEKQAFKTLNTVLVNWVSDVLSRGDFPSDLPSWTDPRFQIYLGYEVLYIYLCSINEKQLANDIDPFDFYIDPFNFYDGLRCWLFRAHPRREKIYTIAPHYFQWTAVLDKALNNPITGLSLFSKAVHLLLFVGNKNKAEEADTQNYDKRKPFFNILDDEIKHLEPEDEENVLTEVLNGKGAFEEYANQAKSEELGQSKNGIIPQKWCNSSLCRFWGMTFCQHIYCITQKLFPQDKNLQETVRDILVKPLSHDSKAHNKILALLEGGRKNAKAVDDIMTLVDKATFPVFRKIWEKLDNQELEEDD